MGAELGKQLPRTVGSEVGINDGRDVGVGEQGDNVKILLGIELGTIDGTAVGRDLGTSDVSSVLGRNVDATPVGRALGD